MEMAVLIRLSTLTFVSSALPIVPSGETTSANRPPPPDWLPSTMLSLLMSSWVATRSDSARSCTPTVLSRPTTVAVASTSCASETLLTDSSRLKSATLRLALTGMFNALSRPDGVMLAWARPS